MARPQKEGIDYFSVDCQFNDKVKLIQAEFGLIGIGCLLKLWQKIYGEKGYYSRWDDDVALVFAQDCKSGASVVKEVVSACLRRGIFDRDMYEKYQILTSVGIQERYAEATDRRTSQKIEARYLLIPMPSNWVNVDNNPINVDNNPENADDNTQSKVNKSKVNNIITTTTGARTREGMPKGHEIVEFMESRGVDDPGREAFLFMEKNDEYGWTCLPNWQLAATRWINKIK
jgi:hypothetical protein